MRIKKFNESEGYDLSFDGFKEVMSEITDDLNCDFSFNLYDEKDDSLKYFECIITFVDPEYPIPDDVPNLDYGFLDEREGGLPFIEDPSTFENQKVRECLGKIEEEKNNLLDLKAKIDSQIEKNKKIGNVLIKLSKLQNRFKSFDNFDDCKIGFDANNGYFSIFFELKEK